MYVATWDGNLAIIEDDGTIIQAPEDAEAARDLRKMLRSVAIRQLSGDAEAWLAPGDDGHVLAVLLSLPGAIVTGPGA